MQITKKQIADMYNQLALNGVEIKVELSSGRVHQIAPKQTVTLTNVLSPCAESSDLYVPTSHRDASSIDQAVYKMFEELRVEPFFYIDQRRHQVHPNGQIIQVI